jgi:hypothetical protein
MSVELAVADMEPPTTLDVKELRGPAYADQVALHKFDYAHAKETAVFTNNWWVK